MRLRNDKRRSNQYVTRNESRQMGLADFVFIFSSIVVLVLIGFLYGYEFGRENKEREMSEREE